MENKTRLTKNICISVYISSHWCQYIYTAHPGSAHTDSPTGLGVRTKPLSTELQAWESSQKTCDQPDLRNLTGHRKSSLWLPGYHVPRVVLCLGNKGFGVLCFVLRQGNIGAHLRKSREIGAHLRGPMFPCHSTNRT